MTREELRKRLVAAAFDPGLFAGMKGDRTLSEWIADAVLLAVPDMRRLVSAPPFNGRLDKVEAKVLAALATSHSPEEYAYGFVGLERLVGKVRGMRSACRSLRAKHLLEFRRGLLTEDGQAAGSGYAITRAGLDYYWKVIGAAMVYGEPS